MNAFVIAALLSTSLWAAPSEPPFLPKEVKTEQDAHALNESLRSLSDNIRKVKKDLSGSGSSAVISGTVNQIPKFTATNAIGNSSISDDGTDVTITNEDLNLSTTTGTAGIYFQDGSSQTTSTIFRGTYSYFAAATTITGASLGPAIAAASTITYNAGGFPVEVSFDCVCGAQNAQAMLIGLLVNGSLIDGQTATKGLIEVNSGSADGVNPTCSFRHRTSASYSGATKFAITASRPDGATNPQGVGSTRAICHFMARDDP